MAVGRGEMAVDAMPAVLAARKRQAAATPRPLRASFSGRELFLSGLLFIRCA
ncbi:MAG: hypothetical protein CM1200mP26_21560 [Acidimicrobiales bacterium]|nr:MAG: hypothetical protein CM1200mP26_21560 [Acidimicrobiales bacterium]